MARLSALRSSDPREDALDSIEVPAAVVCARCGKPDCPGCDSLDETTLPSGVISIVPWERPGTSAWSRLWLTARAATRSAASFFQSLPPGSHTSAFSFSLIAEFYAVVSWAVFISLLVALPLHDIAWLMLKNPAGRAMLARLWVVGTVGFTVVLVVGHAIYGVALDKGAFVDVTPRTARIAHRGRSTGHYPLAYGIDGTSQTRCYRVPSRYLSSGGASAGAST